MKTKRKFAVTHYYAVVVEIEADTMDEAMESAGWGDTNYNVTAQYVNLPGGPNVDACEVPNEVRELF